MMKLSIFVSCWWSVCATRGAAFQTRRISPLYHARTTTAIQSTQYGRGAAIWPESSQQPVVLEDSFPGGVLPDIAQQELQIADFDASVAVVDDETPTKRRRRLPRAIQRILTRAAVKEEDVEYDTAVDKTPAVVAVGLLVGGLVQPVDVLVVVFLSGYMSILGVASRVLRSDGITPVLPSLPPQGHVPALISNPLGNAFTNSNVYDVWLKFGFVLSVAAPVAMLGRYLFVGEKEVEAVKFCARPLFLLCCQAVSEGISRRVMVRF